MTQRSMSFVMMCSFNYDVIVTEERNDYRVKTSVVKIFGQKMGYYSDGK